MFSVLFCSVDSLVASLGIGLWGGPEISRRKWIVAFAMCDAGATLAGLATRSSMLQIHRYGPTASVFTILLAIATAIVFLWRSPSSARFLWVPALLGLDNFFASCLAGNAQTWPYLIVVGLASGVAAWIGFAMARQAGALLTRRSALVASACLLLFALFLAN